MTQHEPARPARKTKIVCTIGPASTSPERLRALIAAGMDVARLNFAHGTHDDHSRVLGLVRSLADELGVAVAVLQDLSGPKVRIGDLAAGPAELRAGDEIVLTARPVPGTAHEVSVSYPGLPDEVRPGDTLLVADGAIVLEVVAVAPPDVRCRVVTGGMLSARKGVNVPSGLFGLPILREQDLVDLRFGIGLGVDYVGVSFVRTAADVRTVKDVIARAGANVPVIAKIETLAALGHMDEILDEADGIMVARGDLSIETPFARVPIVQKELIAKANRRAKPVITATQMLFSMVESPQPTRAEVADVANAVLDGSDAVMLSEETAVGRDPVRAVETMAGIAAATEAGLTPLPPPVESAPLTEPEALALGACELAARIGVDVLSTITEEGRTARLVAKYRPRQPILAVTPKVETYRRLALVRGVRPLAIPLYASREETMAAARATAQRHGWRGKRAIFVASDMIRIGDL